MNLNSKKRADFIKWCINEKYWEEYNAYYAALPEERRAARHNTINRITFAAPKMVSATEDKSVEYQEFCDGFDFGASYIDSDAKQAGDAAARAFMAIMTEAADGAPARPAAPTKGKKCPADPVPAVSADPIATDADDDSVAAPVAGPRKIKKSIVKGGGAGAPSAAATETMSAASVSADPVAADEEDDPTSP